MMDDSRKISQKKTSIGELGRQESTVGEQLLKGLPGQFVSNIIEESTENEEGKVIAKSYNYLQYSRPIFL